MEFMIAGADAAFLSILAAIVVIVLVCVLVCVLVGKFIMYAFGRLRGSGGDTAPRELWERAPGSRALVKAASQLTLAEQLYLLAYDDVGASVPRSTDVSLSSGLTGAVLLELFHRELVRERPDGIVAVVERPGELPFLLEDAMTAIRAGERSTDGWLDGLASELKPIKKTVARSLVKRGVLTEEERGGMLGLIPRTRFPTIDPAPRSELLERVHAVLLSTPRPDPTGPGMIQTRPRDPSEEEGQLLMLLGRLDLIGPLAGPLAPRDRRKQAIRRADQLDQQKRAKRIADRLAGQDCQLSAAQSTVWSVLSRSSYGYNGSGGC